MECICVKTEVGVGRGSVKGYSMDGSCHHCVAQRVIDAAAEVENKKYEDANTLIAERTRKIAEDELIAEGKIEKIEGKVKIKE